MATRMTDRIILGCGEKKASEPSIAWQLYRGPLYLMRLRWALSRGGPHAIVSALHGLIDSWRIVAPYDFKLTQRDRADRASWAMLVRAAAEQRWDRRADRLVVLASGSYREPFAELARQGWSVEFPEPAGLTIGRLLSWHKANAPDPRNVGTPPWLAEAGMASAETYPAHDSLEHSEPDDVLALERFQLRRFGKADARAARKARASRPAPVQDSLRFNPGKRRMKRAESEAMRRKCLTCGVPAGVPCANHRGVVVPMHPMRLGIENPATWGASSRAPAAPLRWSAWVPAMRGGGYPDVPPKASGVYEIRRRGGSRVLWVGMSTGTLRKTLIRHFQRWKRDFFHQYDRSVYDPAVSEVRWAFVAGGAAAVKAAETRAMLADNPRDNLEVPSALVDDVADPVPF